MYDDHDLLLGWKKEALYHSTMSSMSSYASFQVSLAQVWSGTNYEVVSINPDTEIPLPDLMDY